MDKIRNDIFISIFIIFTLTFITFNQLSASEIEDAKTAIESGKYKEAKSILQSLLEDDETNLEAHKNLGILFFKMKRWIRSRQEFEYLLRHNKKEKSFVEPYYKKFLEISEKKYKRWELLREKEPKKAQNNLFMAFRLNPKLGKQKKGDMNGALFYWQNLLNKKTNAQILYCLAYLNEIIGKMSAASDYYAQMLDYVEDNSKIICVIDRYDYLNKTETEKFVQAIRKFTDKKAEFLEKIKEADLTLDERNKLHDFIDAQEALADKIDKAESDDEKHEIIQETILKFKDKYKNSHEKPSSGLKKFVEQEQEKTGKTKEQILKEWGLDSFADEIK